MHVYTHSQFNIFFGNKETSISQEWYHAGQAVSLAQEQVFQPFYNELELQDLILLKQTHSTQGIVLSDPLPASFAHEGDYLITSFKNVGIGILTADCLPVVAVDTSKAIVGIAHAGWRGAV